MCLTPLGRTRVLWSHLTVENIVFCFHIEDEPRHVYPVPSLSWLTWTSVNHINGKTPSRPSCTHLRRRTGETDDGGTSESLGTLRDDWGLG